MQVFVYTVNRRRGRTTPWCLPSLLAGNPLVWMIPVNGVIVTVMDICESGAPSSSAARPVCRRHGQAQHESPAKTPTEPFRQDDSDCGGGQALQEGAAHGDLADAHQIRNGEVQAHAKHQQHDADLSQLFGQVHIGNEARCEGTDRQARGDVSDDGWEAELAGDEAASCSGRADFRAQLSRSAAIGSMRVVPRAGR